jgi:hypothetical protein
LENITTIENLNEDANDDEMLVDEKNGGCEGDRYRISFYPENNKVCLSSRSS